MRRRLRGWLESLPDDVLRVRPVSEQQPGRGADVDRHLRGGRGAAGRRPSDGSIASVGGRPSALSSWTRRSSAGFRPTSRSTARAWRSSVETSRQTVTFARSALDLVGDDDPLTRGAAPALQGLAAWTTGDLDTGPRVVRRVPGRLRADRPRLRRAGLLRHAGRHPGRPGPARARRAHLRAALDLAARHGTPGAERDGPTCTSAWPPSTASPTTCRQPGSDLSRSRDLGEPAGLPQNAYRWRVVMARVCEAEGDVEAAVDLLDEAERLYAGTSTQRPAGARDAGPDVGPAGAGHDALDWAAGRA